MSSHQIRVTGVLVEEGQILLVRQRVDDQRAWSLPGGHVEPGETLSGALMREMHEETGLEVSVDRLLYVAERPAEGLLHITFAVTRTGGALRTPPVNQDANPITAVRFVAVEALPAYGFSPRWRDLVAQGFPDAPAYVGPKRAIGL